MSETRPLPGFGAEKLSEWAKRLQDFHEKESDLGNRFLLEELLCGRLAEFLQQIADIFPECNTSAMLAHEFRQVSRRHPEHLSKVATNWLAISDTFHLPILKSPVKETERLFTQLDPLRENGMDDTKTATHTGCTNFPIETLSRLIKEEQATASEPSERRTPSIHELSILDPGYLFRELKILKKWQDPHVDDQTRTYMICYILQMNGFASLYHLFHNVFSVETRLQKLVTQLQDLQLNSPTTETLLVAENLVMNEIVLPILHHGKDLWTILMSLCGAGLPGGEYLQALIYTQLANKGGGGHLAMIRNAIKAGSDYVMSFSPEEIEKLGADLGDKLSQTQWSKNISPEMVQQFPALMDLMLDTCTSGKNIDMRSVMTNPIVVKLLVLFQNSSFFS